jgi:hypothetical protein
LNGRLVDSPAYVNAVFIGGIVPKRLQQAYGGLQNFPRLTELWSWGNNNQPLQIAGAFLQLNFATTANAPFEHDAWEPGAPPTTSENNGYYRAPTRRWGYDPALLYYPPAAAARRFVSVDTPRSEYYRELPADDPYIVNLRCATKGTATDFVFTANIRPGTCPA